jgi:hypothetical protein
MKRLAKILLALFLVCIGVIALAAWLLPGFIVGKVFEEIPKLSSPRGIEITGLKYDSAHLAGWRGATVSGVAFSFAKTSAAQKSAPPAPSTFDAERITATAASFSDPAVTFAIENFNLRLSQPFGSKDFRFHRFENATWREYQPVRLRDAAAIAREILAHTKALFREGEIDEKFDIEGLAHFDLFGIKSQAHLYTATLDGVSTLRFKETDVQSIAQAHNVTLGPEEVTLIAHNPLKMPGVLEITSIAQKTSTIARRNDPATPEDAYRHLLWSYLLTERFGPEFAKVVTDAHETVPGNSPDERAMDYHNNAIGRRLATEKVPQSTLLETAKSSPRIIRSPQELSSRDSASLLDQP